MKNCTVVIGLIATLLSGCASNSVRYPDKPPAVVAKPIVISVDKRLDVVMTAMAQLNTPYRYGGAHPSSGFDCSGLVAYVLQLVAGTSAPRNASDIAQASRPIGRSKLQPGDLVFFNTMNRAYSHVGIYLGDGQFINAPSSGGHVRIDSLSNRYFASRFNGARSLYED